MKSFKISLKILDLSNSKMVRSLSQWTKTLSFPNRHSKECNVNVHPIQAPPTPARNKTNSSTPSSSPPNSPSNVPITEISQIVSNYFFARRNFHHFFCCLIARRDRHHRWTTFATTLLPRVIMTMMMIFFLFCGTTFKTSLWWLWTLSATYTPATGHAACCWCWNYHHCHEQKKELNLHAHESNLYVKTITAHHQQP